MLQGAKQKMKPEDGPGKCNLISTLVWLCGAIVMLMVSVTTSKWVVAAKVDQENIKGQVLTYGLWQECSLEKGCVSTLETATTYIKWVRAFMLLSLFMAIGGLIATCTLCCGTKVPAWLLDATLWGATIASFAGLMIFTIQWDESGDERHHDISWSCGIGWGAFMVLMVSSIISTGGRCRECTCT